MEEVIWVRVSFDSTIRLRSTCYER